MFESMTTLAGIIAMAQQGVVGQLREPDDYLQDLYNRTSKGKVARHTVVFTATGDGAVGAIDLFTVTGLVKARVVARCTIVTAIQAGATIEVGVAGDTAAIIAQAAGDAPDADEIWHDATPDADHELDSVSVSWLLNGTDIIQTIGTNTIDSGAIEYICEWEPLSANGEVIAA